MPMPISMLTFTFFAPKGGAGRTTAVMAAASGLVAMGKRVTVIDMSVEPDVDGRVYRHMSHLGVWRKALTAGGTSEHDLNVVTAHTLEAFLAAQAQAARDHRDVVLVDTSARWSDAVRDAIAKPQCTAVIIPFTGAIEAAISCHRYLSREGMHPDVRGLATGLNGTRDDDRLALAAMAPIPLLQAALPRTHFISRQMEGGHLPDMLAEARRAAKAAGKPRQTTASARAWAAARSLAQELLVLGEAVHALDRTERPFSAAADDIRIAATDPMKRLCALSEDLGIRI
jgi:MinD-like ATPase involved in chromosome partitioning or flagellar assembly